MDELTARRIEESLASIAQSLDDISSSLDRIAEHSSTIADREAAAPASISLKVSLDD